MAFGRFLSQKMLPPRLQNLLVLFLFHFDIYNIFYFIWDHLTGSIPSR